MIAKIKRNGGESLAETLVAVLLVALVFVFLANAVVTSARINAEASSSDIAYKKGVAIDEGTVTVRINSVSGKSGADSSSSVTTYKTNLTGGGSYYYYEPN